MRAKPAGAEHTVHFYDRPASLAHRIADFAATGLERGEAAIIIATAEHRMATEGRLVALGVDLGSAAAEGRYLPLDAAETLEQLMVDGHPDRARFNEVVGGPVQRAQQARPGLRAYGEMVGLLWSEGKHDAAMALRGALERPSRTPPVLAHVRLPGPPARLRRIGTRQDRRRAYRRRAFGGSARVGQPTARR